MFQSIWLSIPYIAICTTLSLLFGSERSSAQASQSPNKIIRQGASVELNRQKLDLAWVQWQSTSLMPLQIGIQDTGLMTLMGIDLLNTNDSTEQPVGWFSQPDSTPLLLPTLYHSPNRYLEITRLAEKEQWHLSIVGTSLKITTPAASIQTLQQTPLSPPGGYKDNGMIKSK